MRKKEIEKLKKLAIDLQEAVGNPDNYPADAVEFQLKILCVKK